MSSVKTDKNSKSHLFQPGISGNPKGRPKNAFTIRNAITKLADELTDGKSNADKLAELSWKKALTGDRWFIQYVTEHKEGKPHQSQSIEVSNNVSPFELYKKRLLEKDD